MSDAMRNVYEVTVSSDGYARLLSLSDAYGHTFTSTTLQNMVDDMLASDGNVFVCMSGERGEGGNVYAIYRNRSKADLWLAKQRAEHEEVGRVLKNDCADGFEVFGIWYEIVTIPVE